MGVIVAVLVVVILVAGAVAFALLRNDGSETDAVAETSASATTTEVTQAEKEEDPAAVLAAAEINSIHPAPAPEAPEEWGEYQIHDSWEGRIRVFEDAGPEEITGRGGGRFPSTMNSCGLVMYFVTFKSANPNVDLGVHLIDAAGNSAVTEELDQGWSLSTNCETPAMEFLGAGDESTLGDVVFTVHEYFQSSTAPRAPQTPDGAATSPTPEATQHAVTSEPAAPAEPTLVQCLGTLGPPEGLYSDGSQRHTPSCENSPEKQRAVRAEGVCGGLYGWIGVSEAEYQYLCGVPRPTHRTPPPPTPNVPPAPTSTPSTAPVYPSTPVSQATPTTPPTP